MLLSSLANSTGFTHIVLLSSDGSALSVGRSEHIGERFPARENYKCLPLWESSGTLTFEQLLHKESLYKDQIQRIENDAISTTAPLVIRDDRMRVDFIVNLAASLQGPLLDVGCSQGVISLRIAAAHSLKVTGIDIRLNAIQEARTLQSTNYNSLRGKCDFYTTEEFDSTCKNETFSSILLLEVLEHLPPSLQHEILLWISKRLVPEGKCVLSVPNRWPSEKYRSEGRERWNWPAHVSFFSLESFCALVRGYFANAEPVGFPGEPPEDGIWLHVVAYGRKNK